MILKRKYYRYYNIFPNDLWEKTVVVWWDISPHRQNNDASKKLALELQCLNFENLWECIFSRKSSFTTVVKFFNFDWSCP